MATARGGDGGPKAGVKRGAIAEEDRTGGKMRKTDGSEFKVLFKLRDSNGTAGFKTINPLKIADSLKGVSEGIDARILANGTLMVVCNNAEIQKKAGAVKKIAGKNVEAIIVNRIEGVKGVIYGVCAEITEKEMKEQIKGGQVIEVKRFKVSGGGNPSAPVLITFAGDNLPIRVFLGCLSFQVRKYERPPIRCYKCQRFGHFAASCRGNQRCTKCGGEHDVLKCEVTKPKCCNCGDDHMASFRGCPQFKKAKHVQDVKEQNKITYAEALKRVNGRREYTDSYQESPSPPPHPSLPLDSIVVKKESLMAFMVDIVYATKGKESRSDIMRAVVEAAGRFLGIGMYNPENLHKFMSQRQGKAPNPSSQVNEEEEIEVDFPEENHD